MNRRRVDSPVIVPVVVVGVALVAWTCALGLLIIRTFDSLERREATFIQEHRVDPLLRPTRWLLHTGNIKTLAALAILGVFFALRSSWWRVIVFLVAAIVGAWLLASLSSAVVGRAGPATSLRGTPTSNSLPAVHVAVATATYGSLALSFVESLSLVGRARFALLGSAALITLLLAGARVYRGLNYLTDVVVASLLGVVWLRVTLNAFLRGRAGPESG